MIKTLRNLFKQDKEKFRCTMTYKGNTYEDIITVEDKSDSYVSEIIQVNKISKKPY